MARCLLLLVAVTLAAGSSAEAAQQLPLHGDCVVRFATVREAVAKLTAQDWFVSALSPFDLDARMQKSGATREEYLEFVADQATAWPDEDIAKVSDAFSDLREKLDAFALPLPKVVLLVRTTGKEEAGAAYCRRQAIVLPQTIIQRRGADDLERLLIHELFHIVSRHDAELRERLYRSIGFHTIPPVQLPANLKTRKITNPDAPAIDCYIELQTAEGRVNAAPILFATVDRFDPKRGGSFFKYLRFRLMRIEQDSGKWAALLRDGEPTLLDPTNNDSFWQQVGKNTMYIYHPDEILADNFVHLVLGKKKLPTPRIVDAMRKELTR